MRAGTQRPSILVTSAIVLCAAAALPGLSAATPKAVQFPSGDGHQLTGTLWPNDGAPGVLLLHQCNSDRTMYDELGGRLADAGFQVLAIDFRGFGDSKGGGHDLSDAGREDWQRAMAGFPLDAESAHGYLAAQGSGGVAGALGASCGGWQVVSLAAAHSGLGRLAFFSSGLNAEHERDVLRMQDRQLLFITAKGDTAAAGPAGTILYRGGKDRVKLLLYDGEAHGYPLFEQDPELVDKIVDFFRPILD